MKNKILNLSIITAFVLLYSCGDNDNSIDGILDDTTSGAVLRTIELISNEIALGDDNASFSVILEAQDKMNGKLMEKVEVYASFKDNTDDDTDYSVEETFLYNLLPTNFTEGPIGLPRTTVTITLNQLKQFLNVQDGEFNGGDVFEVRFKYITTDGRSFSWENSSANILGGAFYRSPFRYNVNVTCPFESSLAGTHSYVTTNMSRPGASPCGGTVNGTVTWFDTDENGAQLPEGTYRISDFSFGLFESSCWFDDPAFSNGARIKWFCKNLLTLGTDQYSETWTYTIVSVNGAQMTINFASTYNETGTTVITRQGNIPWPAIFQN
ncbi:MAG: hypothetical protein Q8K02_01360 [Flavobacterium sp.]|nr:hypothetical protein [Flavobacterium sp.]